MLRVVESVGVPSWLRNPSAPTQEELEIAAIIPRLRNAAFVLEPQTVLVQWINKLKTSGKNFFKMKNFGEARDMYVCAQAMSYQVSDDLLPKHERSRLHSSLALCFLKLDCPFECFVNCELALKVDPENFKAVYCGATALYMAYDFQKAAEFVEQGRLLDPELKDFEILQKKINSNKIVSAYSMFRIQERTQEFNSHCKAVIESAKHRHVFDLSKNVELLLSLDRSTSKTKFVAAAKKTIEELFVISERFMGAQSYKRAYENIVDMHHIIYTLAEKYKENVSISYFDIFYKKAFCLYYMDDFVQAHKNCISAKNFDENNLKLMMLEARILYKKHQLEEALVISNKCIEFARESAPENIIKCEEILFAITFEIDQKKCKAASQESIKINQDESGKVGTRVSLLQGSSDEQSDVVSVESGENRNVSRSVNSNSDNIVNESGQVQTGASSSQSVSDELFVASTSGENKNVSKNIIFNLDEIVTPDVSDSFCSMT